MYKKPALITFITLLIFNLAASAYCDDSMKKLGRGLSNSFTFFLEIPDKIKKTNDTDGPFAALTFGFVKGTVMALYRAFVGVYEVATFPFPVPPDYRPILTDPEFFYEDRNW